jgi:hypothetical protein
MQDEHLWQMVQLRDKVEALLKRGGHSENRDQLDELLIQQPRALVAEALHSFATGEDQKNTWLTNAVRKRQFEIVAILLYHGADAHQPCPQRNDLTAFDGMFSHYHAQNRHLFYLMATLLNNNDVPPERGMMYRNDHLFGSDPNALLLEVSPSEGIESATHDTPLTMAVSLYLPYTIRYLVERRGARIDLQNGLGLRPMDVAIMMQLQNRNALFHDDDEDRLTEKILQFLRIYQQQADRILALMMSLHPRLGHESRLKPLFPETLRAISNHCHAKT